MTAAIQLLIVGLLAQSPDIILGRLFGNSKVKDAKEFIENNYAKLLEPAGTKDAAIEDDHNVIAIRRGADDQSFVMIVARLDSPPALAAMRAIPRVFDAAHISTKTSLLFVEAGKGEANLSHLLEEGAYRHRVKSCILLEPLPESAVLGPPNSIGSTIVQFGLQSVYTYGTEPNYQAAGGILDVPIKLKIPSMAMGVGEHSASVKGIQSVMTVVLAISGVQ